MKKAVLLLALLLISTVFLGGCFLTDKLSALKQGFNKEDNQASSEIQTPTVVIETKNTAALNGETKEITLYFKNAAGKLVLEERTIPKVEGIARSVMEELIKGPTQAGLEPTLPVGTRLLDINVRPDGLAIVDFSGELITKLPASEQAEKLAVYSIVNTLTQFPTVETVELRVDGQRVSTLLGYVDINENLVRDTSLIK